MMVTILDALLEPGEPLPRPAVGEDEQPEDRGLETEDRADDRRRRRAHARLLPVGEVGLEALYRARVAAGATKPPPLFEAYRQGGLAALENFRAELERHPGVDVGDVLERCIAALRRR